MANAVFLPGVNTVVNGVFGPWAALVNGGIAFANIAPWLGELSHLTGSAPAPIKELHQALESLYKAANANDFDAFQAAAKDVENRITAITETPSTDNFKNCGRMTSWEGYLKPLKDLQEELEHFRTRGIEGYTTSRLEEPLKAAVQFMNGEVHAHTGVVNKALSKVAQEAKKVARDEFGGMIGEETLSLKLQPKLSPLQKLVHDLTKFRTDSERYYPDFVQEELLGDLKILENSHPVFKGIHQYVIGSIATDEGTLLKDLDRHVVAFIRKVVLPQIEGENFYQAYYQAALKLKHVGEGHVNANRADQIQWGKECIEEGTKGPKEIGSLLAAVSFILEMNHFETLDQFQAETHDNPASLGKKVNEMIALIENHPTITVHPEFKTKIEGLIKGLMSQTYKKLGRDSVGLIQGVQELVHKGEFGGALIRLKHLLANPSQGKREASVITQGVAALKEQARAYGIPDSMLAPVDTVADLVDSKLSDVLHSSDQDQRLAPFAKLQDDLDQFRANRKNLAEGPIERALQKDLKGIEAAYPELRGLAAFVMQQRKENATIDCLDRLVAAFIKEQITTSDTPLASLMGAHSNQFFLSLYHAAEKSVSQRCLDTHGQIEEGKRIWKGEKYSPHALMQAVEKMFEARALGKIAAGLKTNDSDTAQDLATKVDVALGALAAHPKSDDLSGVFKLVYNQVQSYIDKLGSFAGEADDMRIHRAQALARGEDYVGALKALKEVLDQGTLLPELGKGDNLDPRISAIGQLAADFESGKKIEEGTLSLEKQSEQIALEERKLAHNLSLFTTFKVLSKRKGWESKKAEEMFEEIIKKVDKIEYDGSPEEIQSKRAREAIFTEELDKLTEAGTIDRLVHWIVFKLVKHFTSQFSKSIVQGAQTALVNPLQRPTKGHHGIMRAANNGILGLLFAERTWRSDERGELGVGEKDDRLIEILQDMNHRGKKGKDLVKEVVDKALEEFNTGKFSNIGILNRIATFVVKKLAQLIVNRMHLADSVLETMSDSIYSERHPNYSLDVLILNQIKELEKILGEEGAEMVIKEGDNGKRLAKQLMDNLFKLLEERKILTPEDVAAKKESLVGRLEEGTDTIVKGVLKDLILFGIEQFQEPKRMNQTVLEILKHANRALRPSEATLLRELFSEKGDDASVDDLIVVFEGQYSDLKTSPQGIITRQECEAALAQKYQSVETELHEAMDRIINQAIGGVVEAQVETLLKTPRQVVLEGVQWIHQQFTPYRAHLVGEQAYIEEMETLLRKLDGVKEDGQKDYLISQIQGRHQKFLIQLQKQLKLLKSMRTEEPSSINRHINQLHSAINQLQKPLNALNSALARNHTTDALKELKRIRKEMDTVQGNLNGVEANLSYQDLSTVEKGKEALLSGVKNGAGIAKPFVRQFLSHHIQGRAGEMVSMYKARSTFASMMQQGVFRSYLDYQPSPNDIDPEETIAQDFESMVKNQWTNVDPTPKVDGLYVMEDTFDWL